LTPADIEFFALSHSHFDHTGNAGLFAGAMFLIDERERTFMFRDEARRDQSFAAYAALETARTTLIPGDAQFDVFGDGTVVSYPAPGHTPGHRVLLVRLAQAGPILLTGDMFHLAESRELRTVPTFNIDREQTLASFDVVEALAAETGARVVRQHVAEDFAAMPAFPEPLR
jgi:glyoxylase-like metal-dependent hydrolase (beta-lactamase superfamily II)